MDIHIPSLEEIKRALHLQERIDGLKHELAVLFGGGTGGGAKRGRKPGGGKRGRPAGSGTAALGHEVTNGERMGAAAKKVARKAKRQMSPEAREKIAAAQRRRWAKAKKAVKKTGKKAAAGE